MLRILGQRRNFSILAKILFLQESYSIPLFVFLTYSQAGNTFNFPVKHYFMPMKNMLFLTLYGSNVVMYRKSFSLFLR